MTGSQLQASHGANPYFGCPIHGPAAAKFDSQMHSSYSARARQLKSPNANTMVMALARE